MSRSRARALVHRLGVFVLVAAVGLLSAACVQSGTNAPSDSSIADGSTTTETAPGGFWGSSGLQMLIWVVVLGGLFYFLLIRPQRTRAKRQQELMDSMAVGDEVQTIGGIYGTIEYFDKETDTAVLQTEGGGKLRVARRALGNKVRPKG